METRIAKINISHAGGTASKSSKTCKVTLPNTWLEQMGITAEDRTLELSFDGETIVLRKRQSVTEFVGAKQAMGHSLKKLNYYDGEKLCTTIYADFSDHTIAVENFEKDPVKTAFGTSIIPDWEDFMGFLEERCIARHRAGLKEYLHELKLDVYDPMTIIQKTEGRMAEDHQWLKIEVVP